MRRKKCLESYQREAGARSGGRWSADKRSTQRGPFALFVGQKPKKKRKRTTDLIGKTLRPGRRQHKQKQKRSSDNRPTDTAAAAPDAVTEASDGRG